jgi:hypothetical protein
MKIESKHLQWQNISLFFPFFIIQKELAMKKNSTMLE